eukprot:3901430-Pyramimonas_sp.AAC.1
MPHTSRLPATFADALPSCMSLGAPLCSMPMTEMDIRGVHLSWRRHLDDGGSGHNEDDDGAQQPREANDSRVDVRVAPRDEDAYSLQEHAHPQDARHLGGVETVMRIYPRFLRRRGISEREI